MVSSVSSSSSGMSAAALKKMQDEMFKKADANNDGSISKDELTQVVQAKDNKNGPSADDVMTKMDTNKDGSISRLESDAGIAKVAQEAPRHPVALLREVAEAEQPVPAVPRATTRKTPTRTGPSATWKSFSTT